VLGWAQEHPLAEIEVERAADLVCARVSAVLAIVIDWRPV